MTADEKNETKKKIINQARILFSKHGFKGTSIRQIADESDVNIAAINYHFGSKEALYWSIISEVYEWMDDQMLSITSQSKDVKDFGLRLFRFMRQHKEYAVGTMKVFLSDQVPPPVEDHPYTKRMREQIGPPGGLYIGEFLKKHHPEVPDEALQWMVICLFSSIFHFATVTSCVHYEELKQEHMPISKIEESIVRMAEALCLYMKDDQKWTLPPKKW